MSEHRYSITSDASQEVEQLLTRFERDRKSGPVDLCDYTPPNDDPAYGPVITELARIDLEYGFGEGRTPDAGQYIQQFPAVFSDRHQRTQLVFEEYRLRRRAGQDVTGDLIGKQYDVDGSRWPAMQLGTSTMDQNQSVSRRFTEHDLAVPKVHYPNVGEKFAEYRLVSRIGEGAFSRVYLARQPDLAGRLVVLKVTPLATDESDRLASLQHTAIIPVYSVHREADLSCICMPFLGATTLADLSNWGARWASLDGPAEELVSTIIDRRNSTMETVVDELGPPTCAGAGELTTNRELDTAASNAAPEAPVGLAQYRRLLYVDALLELVTRSVEGLAYAHRRGIIHRDLKPANILISDDGSPVLLDFNLAVSSGDPKAQIVGGTLPYMSPQQLEALQTGAAVDFRDDVFSMGVVLYELLSGTLPFASPQGGQAFELESVITDRRKPPVSIRKLNRHVTPGLESIINRCIGPDREQRYQDGAELLEDLNRHRQHLPLKFARDRSIRERLEKWSTRHPRLSSASFISMVTLVVLVGCSWLIWQRGERIARLKVESAYQQWQTELPSAIAALSTPGKEPELLAHGLGESTRLLNQWHAASDNWHSVTDVDRLNVDDRNQLKEKLAKLAFMMADAQHHLGLQSSEPESETMIQQARHWNQMSAKFDRSLQPLADLQEQQIARRIRRIQPAPDMLAAARQTNNIDLMAMLARQSGDVIRWRELIETQLDRQPTNATHWFHLALANGRLGDADSAAVCFDVSNRMQPGSMAILVNRGICNLQRGKYQRASSDFTTCLELNPDSVVARFNRALSTYRLKNYPAALDDLNQLVETGHIATRILLMRGQVHDAIGDSVAADQDRRRALDIQPQDADDWVSRGVSQLENSPRAALADFESALLIRPDDYNALNNAAHVYAERLEDPKSAIEMLTRLVEIRPNRASGFASRGILYGRTGKINLALADAMTASTLSPGPREQLQIAGIHALVTSADDDQDMNRERAFAWLARALRSDTALARIASSDADLVNIRSDARFDPLVKNALMIELKSEHAEP